MVHFGEFLKTWSLLSNRVTRQVSFNRTKIGEKCQYSKIQMRHFEQFSNTVPSETVHEDSFKHIPDTGAKPTIFDDFFDFKSSPVSNKAWSQCWYTCEWFCCQAQKFSNNWSISGVNVRFFVSLFNTSILLIKIVMVWPLISHSV